MSGSTRDAVMGRLRRAVVLKATVVLVQAALAGVPPRQDPDALVVPDDLGGV